MKKRTSILVTLALIVSVFLLPFYVQAQTYKGIDIYNGNGVYNWSAIKDEGVQVIIQKATEGTTFKDWTLKPRYSNLVNNFKVGYYHFAKNTGNPEQQAQEFLNAINGLHSDTVLWLDIEDQPSWGKSQAIDYTNRFVNYVKARGFKVGIYTGMSFYYEYLQGHIDSSLPLWLASYGSQPIQFPNVVSWQYSQTGRINGITGNVDLDYFNDSIFTGVKPTTSSQPIVQAVQPQRDTKIVVLQTNLKHLLQWDISIDGIPGPETTTAVKQLQKMTNINVDGIPGSQTKSVINQIISKPTLKYGANGTTVKYLQYRLGIANDGNFGFETQRAVINYERQHGLTVDSGIVGQEVWNSLLGL